MFAEHLGEDIDKKVCLECQRQFTGIVAACPHDGTTLVTLARDPMIGTCLMGKYDIIDVIGHGGMGVVYKGRQVLMERVVAIKMLQSQHIADSMSVKRFHQEGKASSKLNHPHVITVYDFGVTPTTGQPFIVMDFLHGISLADLIKNENQVGVERSIKILCQSTDALDHAHRMGVIHRDLKPSNIMLIDYEDEKDYVKVVDFGVAKLITAGGEQQKLTQMGEVCGSPVYMSPEQVQGLELDNRSDIYSMGVVIYETLTGRLPILGKTMVETMSKHITEMPPRFNEIRPDLYIPERLEAVVFKALAKNPADRHQTMAELTRDLDTAIPRAGKSQVLRTDFPTMPDLSGKAEKGGNLLSRMSLMHWVIVSAAVLLVIGLGVVAALNSKPAAKTSLPNVNSTAAATTTSTGTTASTSTTTPPAPTSANKVPPTATTATTPNPGAATTTTSSPSSTSPANPPKVAVSSEPPKPKPKPPAPPRVAHKPKRVAAPVVEEDVPHSGAAAAAARRNAATASSDPFKSLLRSRGY
ncbi:MAG: serine/threonine protein kinase [Cyanobacteria bacterium SZAS LIN-3]|nr:serine/threonine protein kinase [Cyanobacteria bacterium SZAS LIN-3]